MMLFLAALWWPDAQPAVDRRLRCPLPNRHRDPNIHRGQNIHFVIEVIRRDRVPGSDIRDRTVKLLCRELIDSRQDESRWMATTRLLYLLDPMMAINKSLRGVTTISTAFELSR
ncbi:MAG: hypothetical protein ACRDRU_06685 [Pseudonocardiaceae bacterium]